MGATQATVPWSTAQMKRLSRAIRDEAPTPEDCPTYDEVIAWYNDLAASVQKAIIDLNFTPLLGNVKVDISARAKTIETLRDKLQKHPPHLHIHTVQDVAGVRFEAVMDLDQQDAVVGAIVGALGNESTTVRDLRMDPHSGYRAVHIWLFAPARVEIQVRTHLQGEWANAYESMADVLGRNIRYGNLPPDGPARRAVLALQSLSLETIVEMEDIRRSVSNLRMSLDEGVAKGSSRYRRWADHLEDLETRYAEREAALVDQLVQIKQGYDELRFEGRN